MANFFNSVRITNFKSLKNVTLNDCKRINLLIGKPNVGKSNILEAIGLFGLPYLMHNENRKITQFIRIENLPELFFDGNINQEITIQTDDSSLSQLIYSKERGIIKFKIELLENLDIEYGYSFIHDGEKVLYSGHIDNALKLFDYHQGVSSGSKNVYPPKVKFYKFTERSESIKKPHFYFKHLTPPNGNNLFDVLQIHKELKTDLASIFSEYGLKLLFDTGEYRLRLMKTLADDNIISFPYNSIADTLQRVIFFKAAIVSNQDSIILFEEPEAHCFPPYIAHFTQDVIDAETNQFFIATHSPYVLTTCLERESSRKDVAIFMIDFKDGQTVINRLTDEERDEVYEYGLDLFFNSELFTDDSKH